MTSLCLLALVILFHAQCIHGKAYIEIKFKRYTSTCREDANTNNCDPMFTFCLDKPKSAASITSCFYGSVGESGYYQNTLNIDFGSDIKGIGNPWIVATNSLESSIMLVIRIRDDDVFGDDHLATWATILTEPIYPSKAVAVWSSKETNSGDYRFTFDIRIYCDADSYSSTCSVTCVAQNTTTGHYTCAPSTGKKICMKGWNGPNCEQDINECTSGVCQNNGTCVNLNGDYTCQCPAAYSGKNCTIFKTACDSSPCLNNGTCRSTSLASYNCTCSLFFKGTNCENRQDPCSVFPCQNGGLCSSSQNFSKYWCNCTYPYNGSHCEVFVGKSNESTTLKTPVFTNGTVKWSSGTNESNLTFAPLHPNATVQTTIANALVEKENPTHVESNSSSFASWIIILICVLAFVFLIILLVVVFVWRRKRKQAIKSLKKTQSFNNSMYVEVSAANSNVGNGNIVAVPTTPTDDIQFNPLKPSCSQVFTVLPKPEEPEEGHYADMEDGYVKPQVRPSLVERAHSNQYKDFQSLQFPTLPPGEHVEEPQYEDLDAIRANVNNLQNKAYHDSAHEVITRDKKRPANYIDVPNNTTLPRDIDNVFYFLVPDKLEDVRIPESKPPSPVQFTTEDEENKLGRPPPKPLKHEKKEKLDSDVGITGLHYTEEPNILTLRSDPFSEPMDTYELENPDAGLPRIHNEGYDVLSPQFYTDSNKDSHKDDIEAVVYGNNTNMETLTLENQLGTAIQTSTKPSPPIAPKPAAKTSKDNNTALCFQNSMFGYERGNSDNSQDNSDDVHYPPLALINNINESSDARNSASEPYEGLPEHVNLNCDVPNTLFYKLDFKKDEIEEVIYDNHTSIKVSPQSLLDTPMSTLTRSPPPVAPKPTALTSKDNTIDSCEFPQHSKELEADNDIEDCLPLTINESLDDTKDAENSKSFQGLFIQNPQFSST
ncbi:uncharacterized protein LOC106054038 isoform X1 [Biomphalaria glabrata]|uniref:Uncharacterized protein LOC106054038 isoform X1 n=2 Tax=Biomphalaria glabrata TaxID=6526 RepID=A0A9U8DX19_BIOGL|nr:uncharacterized protein LOC106054038 isoform X1 [Biomphalaria glabrata]